MSAGPFLYQGVAGAGLTQGPTIIIILGLANVLADGFSMAVGNFLGTKSDRQVVDRIRRMEEMHIDEVPEALLLFVGSVVISYLLVALITRHRLGALSVGEVKARPTPASQASPSSRAA